MHARRVPCFVLLVALAVACSGLGCAAPSASARRDLSDAISQRASEAGGKLRGVVLDLRGNPGGTLDETVQVADLFLASSEIVTTVAGGKRGDGKRRIAATEQSDDLTALPLVVIVDGLTASGAEIVAAALRDAGRALVLGTRTAGYGKLRSVYSFDDGKHGAERVRLMLTMAHVLTPAGAPLDGAGVTPDVEVATTGDAAVRLAAGVLAREPSPDRRRLLEAARALAGEPL